MTAEPLSAETIKNFLYASTATVSMQMLKRGFRNPAVNGVRPLNPKATRLVGPAYTLRYIPGREDLDKPPTPSDPPSAQRRAIEETPTGHVLVISTEGDTRSGTLGDILALRLKVRGVAGVLSDGAMRDTPVIGKFDFPVFCAAAAAPPSMNHLHPVEVQTPVGICGVPVYPGDVTAPSSCRVIWRTKWHVIHSSRNGSKSSSPFVSDRAGRSQVRIRLTTKPRRFTKLGSRPANRRTVRRTITSKRTSRLHCKFPLMTQSGHPGQLYETFIRLPW